MGVQHLRREGGGREGERAWACSRNGGTPSFRSLAEGSLSRASSSCSLDLLSPQFLPTPRAPPQIWHRLTRQLAPDVYQNTQLYTMLPVPNPFVIPGARFREAGAAPMLPMLRALSREPCGGGGWEKRGKQLRNNRRPHIPTTQLLFILPLPLLLPPSNRSTTGTPTGCSRACWPATLPPCPRCARPPPSAALLQLRAGPRQRRHAGDSKAPAHLTRLPPNPSWQGIIGNFVHLMQAYGHIPNGIRTYYLNRSQPPLFSEVRPSSLAGGPGMAAAARLRCSCAASSARACLQRFASGAWPACLSSFSLPCRWSASSTKPPATRRCSGAPTVAGASQPAAWQCCCSVWDRGPVLGGVQQCTCISMRSAGEQHVRLSKVHACSPWMPCLLQGGAACPAARTSVLDVYPQAGDLAFCSHRQLLRRGCAECVRRAGHTLPPLFSLAASCRLAPFTPIALPAFPHPPGGSRRPRLRPPVQRVALLRQVQQRRPPVDPRVLRVHGLHSLQNCSTSLEGPAFFVSPTPCLPPACLLPAFLCLPPSCQVAAAPPRVLHRRRRDGAQGGPQRGCPQPRHAAPVARPGQCRRVGWVGEWVGDELSLAGVQC